MSGVNSFLDATDGVFVNVDGQTGEMVRDPVTGELKVVVGSNQPIGGGAGGTTVSAPAQVGPSVSTSLNTALSAQFLGVPAWTLGLIILIIVIGTTMRRSR